MDKGAIRDGTYVYCVIKNLSISGARQGKGQIRIGRGRDRWGLIYVEV